MDQLLWKRPKLEDILRRLLIIAKVRNSQPVKHDKLYEYLKKELSDRGIKEIRSLARKALNVDIRLIELEFGVIIQYSKLYDEYYLENIKPSATVKRFLDTFDILVSLNVLGKIPDYVFTEDYYPVGAKNFYMLAKAIEKSVCIHFFYSEDGEDAIEAYYAKPYAIREHDKRWYMAAQTVGRKNMKTYALDRISNLQVVDVWVQKDDTVNMSEEYKYTYGIDNNGPLEDLTLSFNQMEGNYLKIRPLHSTQQVIKDTADEFIIQLRIRITDDFVRKLMTLPSLKVFRPAILRQKICDYSRSMIRQNKT